MTSSKTSKDTERLVGMLKNQPKKTQKVRSKLVKLMDSYKKPRFY